MIFKIPSHLKPFWDSTWRGWHIPRVMQVEESCPGSQWQWSWGRRQLQLAMTEGCGENKREQKLGCRGEHTGDWGHGRGQKDWPFAGLHVWVGLWVDMDE